MSNKKYTVITGASSGIGYAAAKAFAARTSSSLHGVRHSSHDCAMRSRRRIPMWTS